VNLEFKQFVLARTSALPMVTWRQIAFCGLYLSAPKSVPLVRILVDDELVAWLVGWAADDQGLFADDDAVKLGFGQSLEDFRECLCGRFLLVDRDGDGLVTVSTDGGGLFPVVFDQEKQIVASSPAVIGLYAHLFPDIGINTGVQRRDATVWYPFGLTPYAGIRRLLPSQALRIRQDRFDLHMRGPLQRSVKKAVTASDICDLVAGYVKAFSGGGKLTAHLTAGFDSRMVMAAVLKAGVAARYITIQGPGQGADLDVHVARRLARLSNVQHATVPFKTPTSSELSAWRERVGNCIDDAVMNLCATVVEHNDGAITLSGACGEVGRAFYWTEHDLGLSGLDAPQLVRRLGFLETPLLIDEASRWLSGFEIGMLNTLVLDNAYIDLRAACWAGPSMPGHLIPLPTITPFNSIRVYRAMLALDEEYRFAQRFPIDFIGAASSSLLSERFNAASGLSRFRFVKNEIKRIVPKSIKTALKKFIRT
jgi:hypothetical protein